MRIWTKLAVVPLALALGFAADLNLREARGPDGKSTISVGLTEAHAGYRAQNRRVARRTARRTSRRVTRRHNYYNSLPAGCPLRGAYYYCGGVYYQPVVQDGVNVYIIVTP